MPVVEKAATILNKVAVILDFQMFTYLDLKMLHNFLVPIITLLLKLLAT